MSRGIHLSGVSFPIANLPGLFDPSFLGSSVLGWWAADQGVTVDGSNKILSWNDLSGNQTTLYGGYAPTSIPSLTLLNSALNGLPGAWNAGYPTTQAVVVAAATLRNFWFQAGAPFSSAVAFILGAHGTQGALWHTNAFATGLAGASLLTAAAPNNFLQFCLGTITHRTWGQDSNPLLIGSPYKAIFTYDGSGSSLGGKFTVNGVQGTTTSMDTGGTDPPSTSPFMIGVPVGGNQPTQSIICEVILFNRLLTALEVAALNGYLGSKWGIQG